MVLCFAMTTSLFRNEKRKLSERGETREVFLIGHKLNRKKKEKKEGLGLGTGMKCAWIGDGCGIGTRIVECRSIF